MCTNFIVFLQEKEAVEGCSNFIVFLLEEKETVDICTNLLFSSGE